LIITTPKICIATTTTNKKNKDRKENNFHSLNLYYSTFYA
jgi:hypothetical protein